MSTTSLVDAGVRRQKVSVRSYRNSYMIPNVSRYATNPATSKARALDDRTSYPKPSSD